MMSLCQVCFSYLLSCRRLQVQAKIVDFFCFFHFVIHPFVGW
eukprot:UN20965